MNAVGHSPPPGWACPNAIGLELECCGERLPGGECACCAGACRARLEMLSLASWLSTIEQSRRRGLFLAWALTRRSDGAFLLAVTTAQGACLSASGATVEEMAAQFSTTLAAHVERCFPPDVSH